MGTYKLSNDILILQLLVKVENHLEVIDKVILTINDKKYTFNSLAEYHWQFKRIREPYTRYTIFVDNLDRLYALDKELQDIAIEPKWRTLSANEEGTIRQSNIIEVRTKLPKQDIYRNLSTMLANELANKEDSIRIYTKYLEQLKEKYIYMNKIPKTVGKIEKQSLQNKLENDIEWQSFAKYTKVKDKQMFDDMVKCKTGGLYGNISPWNVINKNCISMDRKSAYPYQMLTKDYPFHSCYIVKNPDMKDYENFLKDKLYMIVFKAIGVVNVKMYKMNYTEKDFEDGVVMTNDMFDVFRLAYIYKSIEVERIYIWGRRRLLPKVLRGHLIDLYKDKETCNKDDPERDIKKIRLNLWYGLGLQYLSYKIDNFDNNCIKAKYSFYIPPVIGLWTVGYQMKEMALILEQMNPLNVVKFDTDSITYKGEHNNIIFEKDNEKIEKILYNIYEDDLLNKLGKWENEFDKPEDIKLLGKKQYIKLNSKQVKAAGCITNKDSFDQVMKDGVIKDGIISYDYANNKVHRRDYRTNTKTFERYMSRWH